MTSFLRTGSTIWRILAFLLFVGPAFAADAPPAHHPPPANRVASIYISEDFINEQIAAHSKSSELIKDLRVSLDSNTGRVLVRGKIQVPVEELRAVNLDPKLGAFRFQVAIRPDTTKKGHLILDFPLTETYFYPAGSKDTKRDRVIIPVQLLSLVLASARGYLAALSGDFSGFDRRTEKLNALVKSFERSATQEKNPDAREELKTQLASLKLQLAAVPIERKQLEGVAREVEHILGFTGEKELNINNDLGARRNALILKLKLSQLTPYLTGVELGGIRLLHDTKDGGGENYMAIDINSELAVTPPDPTVKPASRPPMKMPPSLIMRLNQSLFESKMIVDTEKEKMGSKLRDFKIRLKDDGLHVSGGWHTFIFTVPFDTAVDFVPTGVDKFEVRIRKLKVAGMDLEFMSKFILESIQTRLDTTLKGICTFQYVGEERDHSRALQVSVEPAKLVPAFPDLHLVGVDIRDREFLLKIGHP